MSDSSKKRPGDKGSLGQWNHLKKHQGRKVKNIKLIYVL